MFKVLDYKLVQHPYISEPLPENLKQYKVDTELPSVENQSDRWITEDGDSFYYDMNETV